MRVRLAAVVTSLGLGAAAFAQENPRETAAVSLGGKKVAIEYGRPALKGRAIDALLAQLPAERVWRAGVDQATTLQTEADLMIGGKRVPAGTYTLYVHAPADGDWSLLVNSDPGIPLKRLWAEAPPELAETPYPHLEGYANVAATEVARAAMKRAAPAKPAELFTIGLAPAKPGATLTMSWGDRSYSLDLAPAK